MGKKHTTWVVAAAVLAAGASAAFSGCGKRPPDDAYVTKVSEAKPAPERRQAPPPAPTPDPSLAAISESLAELVSEVRGLREDMRELAAAAPAPVRPGPAPEQPAEVEDAAPAEEVVTPEPPAEVTPDPAPEAAEVPTQFDILPNDESEISWVGYGTVQDQIGGFAVFEGDVELTEGTLESAIIYIEIDMTQIWSASTGLTAVLVGEDFFDTATHPGARFVSTGIEHVEGNVYNVEGNFEMVGEDRSITFPVEMELTDEGLWLRTIEPGFTISQSGWGLTYRGVGSNLIRDEVLLSFEILAEPAG